MTTTKPDKASAAPAAARKTFSKIKALALNAKPEDVPETLAHIARLCIDAGSAPALDRIWSEDAAHENGNYECLCCECDQVFIGHKRRVLCKACSNLLTPSDGAKEALTETRKVLLRHGYCGAGEHGTGDPEINIIDAALRSPQREGGEADPEASIPTYGNLPWDQLGRDVVEAQIGRRHDFKFDPKFYPGHQSPGINFNSLARIVDKYRRAHPPAVARRDWRDGSEIPPVPKGQEREYIVAVFRTSSGKVYSFSSSYLNAMPLQYDDCPIGNEASGCSACTDDGCPTTGWFYLTGNDGDGGSYQSLDLKDGDKIMGWREIPKWEDSALCPTKSQRD